MTSLRAVDFREYALALAYVGASTALAFAMQPYAQLGDLAMIQLLGVVLLAIRFNVQATMFACVVSILAFDYLFVPPKFAFAWTDAKSSLTFVAMLVVAGVISGLNDRLRREEQASRTSAFRSQALYELNVDLSTAADARQLAAVTVRHLEQLLSGRVTILLGAPETWSDGLLARDVREVAEGAWLRHEPLRREGPAGTWCWTPVIGVHAPIGVIGALLPRGPRKDAADDFLLSAAARQFAAAIERAQLANAVHRTELEAQAERLRSSLLSAVSHDLKTPLSTIIAAATTMLNDHATLEGNTRRELLSTIVGEGERLNRLIHNLLSIARLESGGVELRKSPEAIEEIVSSAVARFRTPLAEPDISVRIDPDLPLVEAEPLLLEQVLVNLIENARRYAGANSHISVEATATPGGVTIQVADDGPGIPEEEREKVFEKFYRGASAGKSDGGVGLGLTICRAIVRAHGGRISIGARHGGGALVEFTVPVASKGAANGSPELQLKSS